MNVTKVVLDTNLFVSILLGSPALVSLSKLIRSAKIRLIVSPAQIAELVEVLHRPKFNFLPGDIEALLNWIRSETMLVTPETIGKISRDPKDDFLIASAVAGRADAIVTGDKDLLVLGSYAGIPILSPRQFTSLNL